MRRCGHLADSGSELRALGVFEEVGGQTPRRLLADLDSLHAAYAALLADRPLRLRWRWRKAEAGPRSSDAAPRRELERIEICRLVYIYTVYTIY